MPELQNRNVRLILGPTGSGKTTIARELVRTIPRALILDAGFTEYSSVHVFELADLYKYLQEAAQPGKSFKVSYTPIEPDYATCFEWARAIGEAEDVTLVMEEADRFPTPESMAAFMELVTRGRHYGVHLLALSTYPFNMSIALRRQATEIYSFRQHEPRDLKWLGDVMDMDTLANIEDLGEYEYLRWTAKTRRYEKGKTKP